MGNALSAVASYDCRSRFRAYGEHAEFTETRQLLGEGHEEIRAQAKALEKTICGGIELKESRLTFSRPEPSWLDIFRKISDSLGWVQPSYEVGLYALLFSNAMDNCHNNKRKDCDLR